MSVGMSAQKPVPKCLTLEVSVVYSPWHAVPLHEVLGKALLKIPVLACGLQQPWATNVREQKSG